MLYLNKNTLLKYIRALVEGTLFSVVTLLSVFSVVDSVGLLSVLKSNGFGSSENQ